MENARARDRHLGHELRVRLQELEMLDHRVVRRPADLANNVHGLGLGLDAVEGDAVIELHQFAAIEAGQEIEVPPRAAELTIGRGLQTDILLLLQDDLDLAILDRAQLIVGDPARGVLGARLLEGSGAQQAADHVGAERRLGSLHGSSPFPVLAPGSAMVNRCPNVCDRGRRDERRGLLHPSAGRRSPLGGRCGRDRG